MLHSFRPAQLLAPCDLVHLDRLAESLNRDQATVEKVKLLSNAQFLDHARRENLSRLSVRARSRGEIDGRSEQVAAVFNRFPGT